MLPTLDGIHSAGFGGDAVTVCTHMQVEPAAKNTSWSTAVR